MKSCEDCGGPVGESNAEIIAQVNGLLLCEDCIESMSDELDAYEQEHPPCQYDPATGRLVKGIPHSPRSEGAM